MATPSWLHALGAALALTCLGGVTACDGCEQPAASSTPPASASASAGKSKANQAAGTLRVRVKRTGPRTLGQDYSMFARSIVPYDLEGDQQVAPHIKAFSATLAEQREKRKAAGAPDLAIDFVVNGDVHPTGLLELAAISCFNSGGNFRFLVESKFSDVTLESFSYGDCLGPRAPEAWSCSGVKRSNSRLALHIPGAKELESLPEGAQTVAHSVVLQHNGDAPDWEGLSASLKQAPTSANCLTWVGTGSLLKVSEFVEGVHRAWQTLGRRIPVVYLDSEPLPAP